MAADRTFGHVSGVFVSPMNTAAGMGLAFISLAMALGQLGAGVAQPLLGRWADRSGAARVILAGSVVLAASMAVPALWADPFAIFVSLVVSGIAASAVGSNGLLLGVVSRSAAARDTGLAVGLVGAGTSAGQLVLGPALQRGVLDARHRAGADGRSAGAVAGHRGAAARCIQAERRNSAGLIPVHCRNARMKLFSFRKPLADATCLIGLPLR